MTLSYTEAFEDNEVTVYIPYTALPMKNLPLVIFSSAWNQPRVSYEGYAKRLAEWGYVAILRSYPSLGILGVGDPLIDEHIDQTIRLIDWCELENQRSDSPLFGMVDTDNVGTVGHSLGAVASLGAALGDPRIKATVSLDITYATPEALPLLDALEQTQSAILYVRAGDGGWCSNTSDSPVALFDLTKAPTAEVTIMGADHIDFIEIPVGITVVGSLVCPQGDADPQDVRNIAVRYLISWLNVYLQGRAEFQTYFNGPDAQADIDAGLVSIRLNLQ